MLPIINEILSLPGVLGFCVIDTEHGVQVENLPQGFTPSMADEVNNNVGRMRQMAKLKGLTPQTVVINYNKFIILTLPQPTSSMLVICKPGCNTSLVTTTVSMLMPELQQGLTKTVATPSVPEKNTSTPTDANATNSELSPETQQALDSIKKALFETVGPIADMVFDDCVEQWTATTPGNLSRIIELVGLVSSELDNPELFQEFKTKIAHYI